MAVERLLDVTADINADGRATLDVGSWDKVVIQLVSPSTTANFTTTSDAGGITGVSDGSAASALNFTALSGTKVSDGSAATSLATSDSIEFSRFDTFIRIMGGGLTVSKALVRLYKIN
jgi:hypothetical protein